jgi:iron(III) transport system substrate-binding protein
MYKILLAIAIFIGTLLSAGEVVNVYSHRHYAVDKKLYELFKKQTGIKVNLIKASSAELIKRIEKEGKYTKADVLLTTDVGMLELARANDIFQKVESDFLNKTTKHL